MPFIKINFIQLIYKGKSGAVTKLKLVQKRNQKLNPLNANPEKWSNTLKQIVGNLPTICLSVFDHFMNLALKGLRSIIGFILEL